MKNLQVQVQNAQAGKPLSIKLDGRLTSMSAMDFKRDLVHLMNDVNQDCHVDISTLSQMDVTGVNALAVAHKAAERNGNRLVLLSTEENPASEFLHLTKFKNYFNFQRA